MSSVRLYFAYGGKCMSIQLSPRQVHLDFHTSEYIPGIAEDFDPGVFAKMVKEAHCLEKKVSSSIFLLDSAAHMRH